MVAGPSTGGLDMRGAATERSVTFSASRSVRHAEMIFSRPGSRSGNNEANRRGASRAGGARSSSKNQKASLLHHQRRRAASHSNWTHGVVEAAMDHNICHNRKHCGSSQQRSFPEQLISIERTDRPMGKFGLQVELEVLSFRRYY